MKGVYRFCGFDPTLYTTICLTSEQMAEAATAAPVGAVTGAKDVVQNGNIQLCNMRAHSIVGGKIRHDTLYQQAVFELWPYIAALLTSGEANRPTIDFTPCCGGRCAVLKGRKYVQVRRNKKTSPPPLEDKPVEEQIYGPQVDSGIKHVKFLGSDGDTTMPTKENVLAAKFCPTTADRVFHANTPEKVKEAVKGRVEDVYVPFDLTDEQREELTDVTDALCDELRNSDSVEKIASWLLFGDIKSKKWTLARAEIALNCLMWRLNPDYEFKAAIKLEPMPKGKAPRMLIADGDAGAVMSALTIGVLERYFCKYHKHRTIKGKPKATRMLEICREAFEMKGSVGGTGSSPEAYEAFMMENDGSAWDACCRIILRDLVENKIIDVVYDKLWKFFVPYNWFQSARKKADTKREYSVKVDTKKVRVEQWPKGSKYSQEELARVLCRKSVTIRFDAIRRSGDRGTSILNFIENLVCWCWVLAGVAGSALVKPNSKVVIDIFGVKRRVKKWLEGDDSLLWLTGRHFTTAELEHLAERWTKLGHRPKLFLRRDGDIAEFCGWKICVNKYGLDVETALPDVPRMLKNLGYTTAKEAISAAFDGDKEMFGRVVGPALIARAGSIAQRAPTIARWLVRLSQLLKERSDYTDDTFTREDIFRMGTDDMVELLPEWWKNDDPEILLSRRYESFLDHVLREISNSVASNGCTDEATLAVKHGWVRTTDEWFRFVQALEVCSLDTTDELFRSIVPKGMM
jgi:hypothetical protein